MSLKFRILICLFSSLILTIIAFILDDVSPSISLPGFALISTLGLLLYSPTLYAAFFAESDPWTKITTIRFLKSFSLGLGMTVLGVLSVYFNAKAFNSTMSISWFGLLWVLILFSGGPFNGIYRDKNNTAA